MFSKSLVFRVAIQNSIYNAKIYVRKGGIFVGRSYKNMPTIFIIKGFRFFFYPADADEPAHVHVTKGDGIGKIWLEPTIMISELSGFKKKEQSLIISIVESNYELLKNKWYAYFNNIR